MVGRVMCDIGRIFGRACMDAGIRGDNHLCDDNDGVAEIIFAGSIIWCNNRGIYFFVVSGDNT